MSEQENNPFLNPDKLGEIVEQHEQNHRWLERALGDKPVVFEPSTSTTEERVNLEWTHRHLAELRELAAKGRLGFAPSFIEGPDGRMRLYEVSLVPYKPGDEQYGVHPAQIVEPDDQAKSQ